jgi:hypothetical protein
VDEEPLTLVVELWRADLVTSVLELDEEGNVLGGGTGRGDTETMSELYPPGEQKPSGRNLLHNQD